MRILVCDFVSECVSLNVYDCVFLLVYKCTCEFCVLCLLMYVCVYACVNVCVDAASVQATVTFCKVT